MTAISAGTLHFQTFYSAQLNQTDVKQRGQGHLEAKKRF
jgi:hypothetical protein